MNLPNLTIPPQVHPPQINAAIVGSPTAGSVRARAQPRFATFAAAAPVALCFIFPIVKLKGVVYLYDLATIAAIAIVGFRPIRNARLHHFMFAWWLLVAGMVFGFTSAWSRAEMTYRIAGYSGQFLLGLVFCRSFIHGALSRRIDIQLFARLVALSGLIAATMGVLQFVLLQLNPGLADQLYRGYLDLAGHAQDEYEQIYLYMWRVTGTTRVVGTWTVTTTYGGMMALACGWLLYTSWHQIQRLAMFGWNCIAVLATLSRHAWIVCFVGLFALLWRAKRATQFAMYLCVGAAILVALVVAVSRLAGNDASISGTSFFEQLLVRTNRTLEENVEDGSFQARYVAGTLRFVLYSVRDPMILLVGFGIQTESGLADQSGPTDLMYGYVSNGWLLIWRNCGICGFVGLVLLHAGLLRVGGRNFIGPVLIAAMIIASDNYPVHVPSAFFLLSIFTTFGWAKALMDRESAPPMLAAPVH